MILFSEIMYDFYTSRFFHLKKKLRANDVTSIFYFLYVSYIQYLTWSIIFTNKEIPLLYLIPHMYTTACTYWVSGYIIPHMYTTACNYWVSGYIIPHMYTTACNYWVSGYIIPHMYTTACNYWVSGYIILHMYTTACTYWVSGRVSKEHHAPAVTSHCLPRCPRSPVPCLHPWHSGSHSGPHRRKPCPSSRHPGPLEMQPPARPHHRSREVRRGHSYHWHPLDCYDPEVQMYNIIVIMKLVCLWLNDIFFNTD